MGGAAVPGLLGMLCGCSTFGRTLKERESSREESRLVIYELPGSPDS
jgi:hypothetical protein